MIIKSSVALCWCPNEPFFLRPSVGVLVCVGVSVSNETARRARQRERGANVPDRKRSGHRPALFRRLPAPNRLGLHSKWMSW